MTFRLTIPGKPGAKGRAKYRAQPTEVDGVRFDSKREAAVYADLRLREKAGEISNLELQPTFRWSLLGEPIRYPETKTGRRGAQIKYVADFAFVENGRRRVIDVKGHDHKEGRIKRAVTGALFGIEIEVMK